MEFWEFLLKEDQRVDLANPDNAEKWASRAFPMPMTAMDDPLTIPWPSEIRATWENNILALRNLAARLKKKKLKRRGLASDMDALEVLNIYIGMLRICPDPPFCPFKLVNLPTSADGGVYRFDRVLPHEWTAKMRIYWQCLFLSFLSGGDSRVCQRCGRQVEGRRNFCDGCYWKRWREKQPQKKMRKKWRDDKRNHLI